LPDVAPAVEQGAAAAGLHVALAFAAASSTGDHRLALAASVLPAKQLTAMLLLKTSTAGSRH